MGAFFILAFDGVGELYLLSLNTASLMFPPLSEADTDHDANIPKKIVATITELRSCLTDFMFPPDPFEEAEPISSETLVLIFPPVYASFE